ncbi:MAG TPA: hypothetical protein DCY40_01785 [Actinobacteria bacterium]|nr:hypothetical protein [Actinomycetota bacterium]
MSPRRRPARLLSLLAFRDEMRFLPGYFANVVAESDGVVALDDGSTDGSAEYVMGRPEVLELIRQPVQEPHHWDDARNHRLLVEAARRHRPDWLLGLDADERLEHGFRARAESEIDRARREGYSAYAVWLREVWGSPTTIRIDGIWGRKRHARMFVSRDDHEFHEQRLHCHWAPLNGRLADGSFPPADLIIYHLRMRYAEDRIARRDRYNRLDPDREMQAIGYDYLTDETGIELASIDPARSYRPIPA